MTASNDFRGGSHAYSIKCINAAVTITGLGTFKNTSQTNLITFHRLGYSGKTLYEFQNAGAIDFINKVGKYGSNPSITIVELGTNDAFNSNCTPAQFQTRLQATAQGLVSPGNYVYLCVPYIPNPTTHPVNQGQNFQDFRKVYYTVAKAVGCGVIDLSIMDFVGNNWLSADGLHPNEAGHAAIAKAICDALGIQQKGFMQLQKYTLNMTDISSSGANGSKFAILGSIPYDAVIVSMLIRNKNNGIMVDYREVADYVNGYGLTINKGLNAEPRWGLYKLVNGAFKIQTSNPISSYLSTTDTDNEVIINYLF
jgi:lysophospholipase L1-like esterase